MFLGDGGHDSRAIANIFVGKSLDDNKPFTVTQLVKLVYIAHGWTLGYTNKPLIRDEVQAWVAGPVVPLLYDTFTQNGPITQKATDSNGLEYSAKISDPEKIIIGNVYKEHSGLSLQKLADLTRIYNEPWSLYGGGYYYPSIKTKDIKNYYRKLVDTVNLNKESHA